MKGDKLEKKVAAFKEGDRSAFDYIYEHTNRSVYFAVLYIVRDRMTAEDILHDAFVRAMTCIGQYSVGTNFTAWLVSIGKSLALNHVKL